ncbi:CBO0543 family protein [Ammoniphilus sp. YIM 78166]|uniref:CBO0543 family protein n=1 Tax=Ammoniphilus sp. YIM 78166 TaxID=1644106 RepID=UPI00106F1207|nr:CBO0543 family protein [Ammoniphilus sp. YIM 78166]
MTSGQEKQFLELYGLQKKTYDMWTDYWFQYVAGTWQFWVYVAFIIVPLVVLYFYLDRKKAYFLGFYGFCVHMLAAYIDAFGTSKGLWGFPYKAVPVLPASFSIDAVLIPVSFMLTYQWTLNRNKNYYLYLTLLSVVFAFGLKPLLSVLGLFVIFEGTTFFHIFLWYFSGVVLSKWVINIFIHFRQQEEQPSFPPMRLFAKKEKTK